MSDLRIAFFGAAPDTANLGVSALFLSIIEAIALHSRKLHVTAFDNGWGARDAHVCLSTGRSFAYSLRGARGGYRYHRPENLALMSGAARLGALGRALNPAVRVVDACHAVLDVSGGDSFSDIYGPKRFWNIVRPKLISLRRGVPLILLPQTYGPFSSASLRSVAQTAVRGAAMAWARDHHSFDQLRELLGREFDETRHFEGVDLAFALQPTDASRKLSPALRSWIEERDGGLELIGINVSGLIHLGGQTARDQYNLRADYDLLIATLITRVLQHPRIRIVLVPHVMSPVGHYESDLQACLAVRDGLPKHLHERVIVSPLELDAREAKWLIGHLDWFCGTRMHSTIAGLSMGVPTAAIAYSDKTRGVFASCGAEDQVIDPRVLDTEEAAQRLLQSFCQRASIRQRLAQALPAVIAKAQNEMLSILTRVEALNARSK
jgi:colanic acid/amylovoran biosynthesis protein